MEYLNNSLTESGPLFRLPGHLFAGAVLSGHFLFIPAASCTVKEKEERKIMPTPSFSFRFMSSVSVDCLMHPIKPSVTILLSVTSGEGEPGRVLHWRDKNDSLPDGGTLQRPADSDPPEAPLHDAGGLPC